MDVSNNPLDSTEFLERLRADWAKQCNLMLPEGVRIDHRSLEAQGIERIPTIHEGHASREICLCSMVLRPVERLVFSPKER